MNLHGRIRVFCQQKMMDNINSAQSSKPYNAEQTIEFEPIIPYFRMKMHRGWGYFLIERSEDSSTGVCAEPQRFIDLYLYNEGE